ncbi:MAG TPA: DegT/DnrJ/EryC1/StrS family aminotransferase [Thermogutta sp.]|mgnify:CR=1 FL=1|nr:DegT/DnrJ/EryC1/StrS family aminotransferase [Thermogutta sp.]HPU06515.1 DegT/DnrJ/EryC1/StrS family aminotransferase [Thermogutta sp.]HQF12518.1 DegT/DnrJ/EryC1/StrS family aminotransferase [Thermogutta sp.]
MVTVEKTPTIATPPLAIEGGSPVRKAPFPPWPVFEPDEVTAVVRVLQSGKVNYWTGQEARRFEEEFAQAVECRYAVAVANGTVALEAALEALGIGPGDEVVVTCRSFVASAACVLRVGATPVFADVDRDSQNITAETIAPVLTPRTRAVIAVHLAGWPCDMDPIMELASRAGLAVIEDCAQAHGARYKGQPVGSLGHIAAFSFCQDKIITTGGEGGMVTTNDPQLWRKVWELKDHGKNWDLIRQPGNGTFRWVHESLGTNWRMTEMQAAIGRVALTKLENWVGIRRANAAILRRRLAHLPALRIPSPPPTVEHSYYKFYAFLRPEFLKPGWDRDRILAAIQAEGIPCGAGVCPEIYREKLFQDRALGPAAPLPVAHELGQTSLMFLIHPTLEERDMIDTATAIEKVLTAATVG